MEFSTPSTFWFPYKVKEGHNITVQVESRKVLKWTCKSDRLTTTITGSNEPAAFKL